MSNIPHRT